MSTKNKASTEGVVFSHRNDSSYASICVRVHKERSRLTKQRGRNEAEAEKLLERGVALPVATQRNRHVNLHPAAGSTAVAQLIRRPVKRKRALEAQHCSRSEPTDHRSRKNLYLGLCYVHTAHVTRAIALLEQYDDAIRLHAETISLSLSLFLSLRVRDIADTSLDTTS